MPTLLQYLATLANDPSAQQKFGEDPEGSLAKSGLSDQDQAVLRTRNGGLIQAIVGQQAAAALIYADSPQVIYAAGPQAPVIYASAPQPQPQVIYGVGATQVIYATGPQPQVIYGVGAAQVIYAAGPQVIYGVGAPQPQPQVIYGVGAPQPQPQVIYGVGTPQLGASPPMVIYSAGQPHPAAVIYASHAPAVIYSAAQPAVIYGTGAPAAEPAKPTDKPNK